MLRSNKPCGLYSLPVWLCCCLLPGYFGGWWFVHWQINGTCSSPASAAHKGRISWERPNSLLGLQPPMGVVEGEATEAIGELVWSHAAYQIELHSVPARPLHNWHKWRGKKHLKKTQGGWWYTRDDRWVLTHFYSKSLTKLNLLENKYNAMKLQLFKLLAEQKLLSQELKLAPFSAKTAYLAFEFLQMLFVYLFD